MFKDITSINRKSGPFASSIVINTTETVVRFSLCIYLEKIKVEEMDFHFIESISIPFLSFSLFTVLFPNHFKR